MIKIALAGNPNSGKTTIFNYLTGKNERVGNWTGVTVDVKEGTLRRKFNLLKDDVTIIDLPGTYSSEGYTRDESLSLEYLKSHEVDAVLNVIDVNQLERGLLFTLDLLSCGKPVVVVLNKQDIAIRQKLSVDVMKLKELLSSDVVMTQAINNIGVDDALRALLERLGGQDRAQA
jgi:ferrous iron transport protein B